MYSLTLWCLPFLYPLSRPQSCPPLPCSPFSHLALAVLLRLFLNSEIVKRRRAFEYALRRRTSRKVDYLKYIEVCLDAM